MVSVLWYASISLKRMGSKLTRVQPAAGFRSPTLSIISVCNFHVPEVHGQSGNMDATKDSTAVLYLSPGNGLAGSGLPAAEEGFHHREGRQGGTRRMVSRR